MIQFWQVPSECGPSNLVVLALCHKWDVKNDFAYVLQFFSLISDGLGSVPYLQRFVHT